MRGGQDTETEQCLTCLWLGHRPKSVTSPLEGGLRFGKVLAGWCFRWMQACITAVWDTMDLHENEVLLNASISPADYDSTAICLSSCSSSQSLCPPTPQRWTTAHITATIPPSCTSPMEVISWRSVYSSRTRQQAFTAWPSWRYGVIPFFCLSVSLCVYIHACDVT